MDPFGGALLALFNAPGSDAARHLSTSGAETDIRVIVGRASEQSRFGDSDLVQDGLRIEMMISQVPLPEAGDIVTIMRDGAPFRTYALQGEPMPDVEGLTWTMSAQDA